MKHARSVGRVAAVLCTVLGPGACGGDDILTGPVDSPAETAAVQTSPVRVDRAGGEAGLPRVLIDASRDGGVWWFPQVAPFSGSASHQGLALTESLRAAGYVVEELPRPFAITGALLSTYDIVIRATAFGTYTVAEVTAYREYVDKGGKLLLLADHMANSPSDGLALGFGITFAGVTRGENRITAFGVHPVTEGVVPLTYMVGSGIVGSPASAQIVGRLSSASYLDLNRNSVRDSNETSAPAVLGVMAYGSGRIVFCGDTNLWEQVPQPLLKNVLDWFKTST